MKLKAGDRVETTGTVPDIWLRRRATVERSDYDHLGNPEAAIVLMDPTPDCPGCAPDYAKRRLPDGSCRHRFAFKYVRKFSILELIAEAAA